MNTTEKVKFISTWIKNYVDNMPSKAETLVIGISGGIDSSVSSTLSAMTGLRTIVLSMPIKQKSHQHDLSLKHQEWLVKNFKNVEAHTVNLDELFLAFSASMSKFENEHGMANSRARLRMTTLYQVAAANKGIVVGTGNKVEDFGVGFYTKYGDGGVDLSPIADLMKSEVYALGKLLEVTKSIINAAPTDGLFGDNRTDEDQIGASYDELEWAMKMNDLEKQVNHIESELQVHAVQCEERWKTCFNRFDDMDKSIGRIETILIGASGSLIAGGAILILAMYNIHV